MRHGTPLKPATVKYSAPTRNRAEGGACDRKGPSRILPSVNQIVFPPDQRYCWLMRARFFLLVISAALLQSSHATAATGRIIKVLPHLLDLQGHHALSPSLYDRDAYQA